MKHVLLAVLLLVPGCLVDQDQSVTLGIACLGDSNTVGTCEPGPSESCAEPFSWVYTAQALLPHGAAVSGGHGVDMPFTWHRDAYMGTGVCPPIDHPEYSSGAMLLWNIALTESPAPDVVIAAFGTNDRLHTPEEIVACYQQLAATVAPRQFLVALTPPAFPPQSQAAIDAVGPINDALRAAFPAAQIVDFWTGFDRSMFNSDGLHVNRAGQALRAQRAVAAATTL